MYVTEEEFPIHFAYDRYAAGDDKEMGNSLAEINPQLAEKVAHLLNPSGAVLPSVVSKQPIDRLVDQVFFEYKKFPEKNAAVVELVVNEILRPVADTVRVAELIVWIYDIETPAGNRSVFAEKLYLLNRALFARSNGSFASSCILRRDDLHEEDRDEPSGSFKLLTMCAVHALGAAQL